MKFSLSTILNPPDEKIKVHASKTGVYSMKDKEHTPHRHQELEQHEVTEVLTFLKRYGKMIGAGVAVAMVTLLVSRGCAVRKANRMAEAEALLSMAQTPEQLQEVVEQFGSTPAAPAALLDLAKTRFNEGNTEAARTRYGQFLAEYKKSDLRPVAELGLAYCTEADGDWMDAVGAYRSFLRTYEGHWLEPVALLSLARTLEQAGETADARIVLEDFLAENPDSLWAGNAQAALERLEL
jgi:TolA-binding protein